MKSTDSVLLLGSGALKIGEAGEFDYSGTQAIKALKEEGKRVVLVNPNVATIQTSEGLADEVYFYPVTPEFVTKVIAKEKPNGILLSFGGQTALNCGLALFHDGTLKRYRLSVLGTPIEAILATEDREIFSQRLRRIGLETAHGKVVHSTAEGLAYAETLGYSVMLRAGFALGGSGSGIAKSAVELEELLTRAFATTRQVIVEECLVGWKEIEYEVVRDREDNCITVCNMENFDPVGIHTGESIVVAPSQTLTNHEYYLLRQSAIATIRMLGIIGECNIQYAVHPKTGAIRVIEVNARLSRSSALASKATGYPLAYIAAKLALGHTLAELKNSITKVTSAFFEPALDYVVVKIPRWDLEKYTNVSAQIGSEMKSVGEVMAIGRTFEEAIQKATRMLSDGYNGVIDKRFGQLSKVDLTNRLREPDSMRLFTICSALRAGVTVATIAELTGIDPWFLFRLSSIVDSYNALEGAKMLTRHLLVQVKRKGFSDRQIADILGKKEEEVRKVRKSLGVVPVFKRIDTMAGEFPAMTNYLYCTYAGNGADYIPKNKEKKIIVLGCGPYAIGTSVEFDWCAVNAGVRIRKNGYKSVMINCNPETVSTDYDMSDYLYFEELTLERVLDIYDIEQSPMVVSVGGQIPNNLASKLETNGVPILGTAASDIYKAESRQSFSALLDALSIAQPDWGEAETLVQAKKLSQRLGYPVLVRPSFVLSGKAMSIIESDEQLELYMKSLPISFSDHPLVLSKFLARSIECDYDGVADNGTIVLHAISEHIEGGGVHSGDSTLVIPPHTLSKEMLDEIHTSAKKIIHALTISGPVNIQFLIEQGSLYVIECNIRASRSFPFISKMRRENFIHKATDILLGIETVTSAPHMSPYYGVKVPQFSFHKLRGADPILSVEMSSTGEVCGLGRDPYEAYLTALIATGVRYPTQKAAFISLGGSVAKLQLLASCQKLSKMGYTIYCTAGTSLFLKEHGTPVTAVGKVYEGKRPNAMDLLRGKRIDFAIVLPEHIGDRDKHSLEKSYTDGYVMRRTAIDMGIPIFTNAQNSTFFVETISRYTPDELRIRSWREFSQNG